MEDKSKELLQVLRSLDDNKLLMSLKVIYEDGYVDGYNGNDIEIEFKNWLEEWCEKLIK